MTKKIIAREILYFASFIGIVILLIVFYYGSIQVRDYYNEQYEKEDNSILSEIQGLENESGQSKTINELDLTKRKIEDLEEERVALRKDYATFVGPKAKYEYYHWNIVYFGAILFFAILFPLRYLVLGVKWSLSTLRNKE